MTEAERAKLYRSRLAADTVLLTVELPRKKIATALVAHELLSPDKRTDRAEIQAAFQRASEALCMDAE